MTHPVAEYLERALRATIDVAEAFPRDKFDFWPTVNTMTVGEQIEHLTQNLDYVIAPIAASFRIPSATGPVEDPVARLTQAVQRVDDVLGQIGVDDWTREIRFPDDFTLTVMQATLLMLEHDAHHRGQLIVALRLLGIDPPKRWPAA